jgi:H+/Cl- antiporter ClcA
MTVSVSHQIASRDVADTYANLSGSRSLRRSTALASEGAQAPALPPDGRMSPTTMRENGELHRITFAAAIALRLLAPAVIGGATGAFAAGASWLTEDQALTAIAALPWPALFSPLALLATLAVVQWVTRTAVPSTSELYIVTYHAPSARLPLRQIPGRVLGAMATVSGGGSQGLESASAVTGAAFGDILGRLMRVRIPEEVFSSPGVGTLYGIEIPFRRDIDARRLVPCAVAAASSFAVRDAIAGARHLIVLDSAPIADGTFMAGVVLVGIACGLGARLFARGGEFLKELRSRGTPLRRAAAAGAVLATLAVAGQALSGTWITFGPGYIAARWLEAGPHPIWLLLATLLVRTAGTLTCVYGGGGGGVFTSLACTGVFVGQIVAELLGRTESYAFPFLGAACFLASGYRLPLACMLFVLEGANSIEGAVSGLVAVAIGQVLMGRESVSEAKHKERLD